MSEVRSLQDKTFHELSLFYSPSSQAGLRSEQVTSLVTSSFSSPVGYDLPTNVQLISLEFWNQTTYLLRLGHAFSVEEDATLSQPVVVDIEKLLAPLLAKQSAVAISEMSLSANQLYSEMLDKKLKWVTESDDAVASVSSVSRLQSMSSDSKRHLRQSASSAGSGGDWTITLQPMQVRTFFVSVLPK